MWNYPLFRFTGISTVSRKKTLKKISALQKLNYINMNETLNDTNGTMFSLPQRISVSYNQDRNKDDHHSRRNGGNGFF